MIVPIVLYHGAAAWSAPRSFEALIDVPPNVRPAIEPYLVRFAYLLDDLSAISDDDLRQRATMTALAQLVTVCFKYGRTRPDLVQILGGDWVAVLRKVATAPHGLEALALVMRYILAVSDYVEPEALQALLDCEIGPQAKDTIVTAAQRYIQQGIQQGRQEGIQEGRQEGIQQGRQEGIQQGKRELLLSLLRQRFGNKVDAEAERRIATASVHQIEAWTARVLSAVTLTELLAD
ncbi:MAG TPA: Rpn family recombination-promoting nuclease/putative transposase [Kofleriaceae bacterium]|nr:Rpn family recombination-promoting nuclease/putative transposase [Kofleriaceae bacterium]